MNYLDLNAVEFLIMEGTYECPICKIEHHNYIVSRSGYSGDRTCLYAVLIASDIMYRIKNGRDDKEFCSIECVNKWIDLNPEKVVIELASQ